MTTIQSLASSHTRIPTAHDKVLNNECCFTFQNAFRKGGVCVSLQNWMGVAEPFLQKGLYVRITKQRVLKETADSNEPTKLAIGVEGGFQTDLYDINSQYSIVAVDETGAITEEIPFDKDGDTTAFPQVVTEAANAIIVHAGMTTQQALQENAWQNDEEIPVSKNIDELLESRGSYAGKRMNRR